MEKKIKLLLVTKLWTGLQDFFLKAQENYSGMVSFGKVFFKILESDEFEKIYTLLYIPKKDKKRAKINIPEKYRDKLIVYPYHYSGKTSLLLAVLKSLITGINIAKSEKIDLIYGHGKYSSVGSIISKITKIPNIRRLYGAYGINNTMKNPKVIAFLKDPLAYLSVTLPAEAVIMTNDGTYGDKHFTQEKLKKHKIKKFYFLLNGVDKEIENKLLKPNINLPDKFLLMISRIEKIKGQENLIEALNILKKEGITIPALIVGQISDNKYYKRILRKIEEYELQQQIKIISGLRWEETMYILKHATLNLLLSPFSNLNNVLLESLILGTPTIAIEHENNLKIIPDEALIKLPCESIDKPWIISESIIKYLSDEKLRKNLSNIAKNYAMKLQDWDLRVQVELHILKTALDNTGQQRTNNNH